MYVRKRIGTFSFFFVGFPWLGYTPLSQAAHLLSDVLAVAQDVEPELRHARRHLLPLLRLRRCRRFLALGRRRRLLRAGHDQLPLLVQRLCGHTALVSTAPGGTGADCVEPDKSAGMINPRPLGSRPTSREPFLV